MHVVDLSGQLFESGKEDTVGRKEEGKKRASRESKSRREREREREREERVEGDLYGMVCITMHLKLVYI